MFLPLNIQETRQKCIFHVPNCQKTKKKIIFYEDLNTRTFHLKRVPHNPTSLATFLHKIYSNKKQGTTKAQLFQSISDSLSNPAIVHINIIKLQKDKIVSLFPFPFSFTLHVWCLLILDWKEKYTQQLTLVRSNNIYLQLYAASD